MPISLERIGATVEKYMLDEIVIVRKGEKVMDPITLELTATETVLYTGKAMVSPMGDPASTRIGEREVQRTQYEIAIPRVNGAIDFKPNDIIRVTTSANPELLERDIFVHDTVNGTFFTHVRFKGFYDEVAT